MCLFFRSMLNKICFHFDIIRKKNINQINNFYYFKNYFIGIFIFIFFILSYDDNKFLVYFLHLLLTSLDIVLHVKNDYYHRENVYQHRLHHHDYYNNDHKCLALDYIYFFNDNMFYDIEYLFRCRHRHSCYFVWDHFRVTYFSKILHLL